MILAQMVNDNTPTKQRIMITFGKLGALKYTSNLDLAKIWERVLRRANLPILYSKGFNTRPRIQLASALPLGITSEAELLDVSLKEAMPLDGLIEQIEKVSPAGLRIYNIAESSTHTPALQTLVRSAEYRFHFENKIDRTILQERIDSLLSSESMIRSEERKGRKGSFDLRPLIYNLQIDAYGDLIAHLAAGEHGNFRPDDLLTELDLQDQHCSVHRLKLKLENSK
jgi:radical SAM-linked protein